MSEFRLRRLISFGDGVLPGGISSARAPRGSSFSQPNVTIVYHKLPSLLEKNIAELNEIECKCVDDQHGLQLLAFDHVDEIADTQCCDRLNRWEYCERCSTGGRGLHRLDFFIGKGH